MKQMFTILIMSVLIIQPGTGTTQGRVGQGEAAGVGKRAPHWERLGCPDFQ